ncbi:MAG: replicative DNA helicase [Bacteroidota bacterium]
MKSTKNTFLEENKASKSQEGYIPQAIDLEKGILGALLLEQDTLTEIIEILKPNHFYQPAHRAIYNAIITLFNLHKPIDLLTIVEQLRKHNQLEHSGGAAYLAGLTENVASAAHSETYARLIIEYAVRRDLIETATHIKSEAQNDTNEIFELLDASQRSLFTISEGNVRKNYTGIGPLMKAAIKDLEAGKMQKNAITGIPSGFAVLDRLTLGWQKSDFIVVAARPGMGKTSFLLSMLCNASITHQFPVAIFSLEMSEDQIAKRLIAMESGLENQKLKRKQLKQFEWEQIYHKTTGLYEAPMYIDDTPGLSLFEFRAKCRRLKARHDIKLIAIDYLQLMSADLGKKNINREQEIATISRGLKAIAKELNIPIIAASQLSRAVEIRGGDKRPQLSDLRESGAIEQDVDLAVFLYRPSYYGITQEETGKSVEGLTEVIVAKHRNGPLGSVSLTYLPSITKFTAYEEPSGMPQDYQAVNMPF